MTSDLDTQEENKLDENKIELLNTLASKGLNKNVAIVPNDTPLGVVIELMVVKQISSVLTHDQKEYISGIITESDIVHRFTLLEFDDKLEKSAITLASRPVMYIKQQSYQEDLIKIHIEKHIHHFPIVNSENPKINNVIGLITIGSFVRQFILDNKKKDQKENKDEKNPVKLYFLNGTNEINTKSIRCLENLGVSVIRIEDFHDFYNEMFHLNFPLMFDIDSFPVKKARNLIQIIKKYQGPTIFLSHNSTLVKAFRLYLNPERQIVSLKPIDYSYIYWLLNYKWSNDTKKV